MSNPSDVEARDLADLGVKVDANRSVINALGERTAAGFEETRRGFEEMRRGFAEMRGELDQVAGGQQHITDMLTTLFDARGEHQPRSVRRQGPGRVPPRSCR